MMIGRNEKELTQEEYDALTKAQKNNGTIYFITDGNSGSGGSGTTYTVLSDTTQTTNAWVNPITISCNPLDYDVIIFDISNSGGDKFYCITFPQTLPLDSGDGQNCKHYALEGNFVAYPARFSDGMGLFTSTDTTLNVNKVTGIKFSGSGSSEIEYSTTEHKIGTWIDGSDLYEKTIVLSSLPSTSGYNTINHGIADVDFIFLENATLVEPTGQTHIAPYGRGGTGDIEITEFGKTSFLVWVGLDRSSWSAYITVRYTKEAS